MLFYAAYFLLRHHLCDTYEASCSDQIDRTLVAGLNYESWHIFCWSNNKKKKKDLWYKLGFVELLFGLKGLRNLPIYFICLKTMH